MTNRWAIHHLCICSHILGPVEYESVLRLDARLISHRCTPTSLFYQSFTRVLALWYAASSSLDSVICPVIPIALILVI